ncbi:glycogen/starch/alpha-glucan phosphorylase [Rhodovarius crocodyli]|uniref:Alpha-1,4 glucan phosphorylase n=1 Tax=Rhodovarius crocodyli TaxID=1979269 RepID=A0A437MNV0_9PROT|nr:glycogen/starch/alpha-glucan family phosphorylase [Rhodovarius crocodyli]RVT99318.1 glycogen/starch/alpha-glucan phosphorylase [Rhodovarius crocodyli]
MTPPDTVLPVETQALRDLIIRKLTYTLGKPVTAAQDRDWFVATALAVRDRITERFLKQMEMNRGKAKKHVYYLSLEFLIGRLLRENANNLGLVEEMREALADLGVTTDQARQAEPDAALGNGGLGRLAACFLESMSSLAIPAFGYGIRYDHGLFRQILREGWQQEFPEDWLNFGNPWEFARPEFRYRVGFGGEVSGDDDSDKATWTPGEWVDAVAYDVPVVGWRGEHVNLLRLWHAQAPDPLRLDAFNSGDHHGALAEQVRAESISKVLYPADDSPAGQELRLRQEYFFTAAALADVLRRQVRQAGSVETLADHAAIQLNDTHPAIAVAELMRLLVDEYGLAWAKAWEVTRGTISYTNHTLLPEALESWPVHLMERMLPRHMQIIYRINAEHLDGVRAKFPGDDRLLSSVSLIGEDHGRRVRMGHLAFVGSHHVNGVSALHTGLMKQTVFSDFHRLFPHRIVNKTNGIAFRRWLFQCNPGLTSLLVDALGPRVLDDASALTELRGMADDAIFQGRYAAVKRANKEALAVMIQERTGVRVDPAALFDVQIKRIHEYKRQLLNVLQTVALYESMRAHPMRDWTPVVKIFAGKAAPGYHRAKQIIKLAWDVARVVNRDPAVRGLLKVAFIPNYNVSAAEVIVPAADLSEQISTAGMEASGTGNMKLALNGALTIGTLDGATVEMAEHIGHEHLFLFGLSAAEVADRKAEGWKGSRAIAASDTLGGVLDAIEGGVFSPDDRTRYRDLVASLRGDDWFMVTADFDSYLDAQKDAMTLYRDTTEWRRKAVLNTAGMGWFSSDRSISEYAKEIWNVPVSR